jgi:hypothetical protein
MSCKHRGKRYFATTMPSRASAGSEPVVDSGGSLPDLEPQLELSLRAFAIVVSLASASIAFAQN